LKSLTAGINDAVRGLLVFLAAWLISFSLCAQDVVSDTFPGFTLTSAGPQRIDVLTQMGVLIDPDGSLTLDQIIASQDGWQTITRSAPNFGFTSDAHWFRFQLINATDRPVDRIIELPIAFLDDVKLYHLVDGKIKTTYALGDAQPFALRPVRHPHFVMPVALSPGVNKIYLRVASTGTVEATFRVWEPLTFHATSHDVNLLQGAFSGVLLIMVVYNLFLFFSIRDLSYIYFIGFTASYLLFHLTLTGYAFAYLWPNATHWNSFAIATLIASTAFFTCLFANSFLKLRYSAPNAHRFLNGMAVVCLLFFISTFFLPYQLTVRIGAGIVFPVALSALILGYWQWWRGAQFARFYCLAWTAMLLGLAILSAEKFGLMPSSFWTDNAPQIGILLLVVLLSLTLADRINSDRSLRLDAQAEALDSERAARTSQTAMIEAKEQANLELEKRVIQRTNDLNQTMEKLQFANTRLQHLSTTDGLTQIGNRAYFDQSLETEHRRATRLGTSLAVILFDIDHFKNVNDTYGHPAGDECLRSIGEVLRAKKLRGEDVVARYGGEEFVVLRVNGSLANSIELAENLRAAIENLDVKFDGQPIRFTASFGVAVDSPCGTSSPQDLVNEADKALYRAKSEGRNCVRVGTS
jgi:diguanylate cyclase (GGDEF)-like protein